MTVEIKINAVAYDGFPVEDENGNLITGLVDGNFTKYLYNPSGTEVSGTITVTITELSYGNYRASFTPNAEGLWILDVRHATHFANGKRNSYVCNSMDADVTAILVDTDTMEADLKTYMDTKESNIRGGSDTLDTLSDQLDTIDTETNKIQTIDDNVDAILADTDTIEADLKTYMDTKETNIIAEVDGNETKIDAVKTDTAAILLDTDTLEADLKTYMDTKESNIRGGADTLDSLSDQIDPVALEANATTNTSTITTAISTTETNIRGTDSDDLKDISDEIAGLNNLSSSDVQTVLETNDLDHLIQVSAGAEKPTVGSYLDKIMNKDGVQTFTPSTDSLESISESSNSVLEDTDTIEADLKTYMDGKSSTTDGLITTVDTVVDLIKTETDKIQTVDNNVDSILEDTDTIEADLKTYMDTKESNIRGGSDTLDSLSDQIDGIDVNTDEVEAKLDEITVLVTRVLGLTQENFKIDTISRDENGKPTSSTITIYTDATMITPLSTYLTTTTYDGSGFIASYTMVKQ